MNQHIGRPYERVRWPLLKVHTHVQFHAEERELAAQPVPRVNAQRAAAKRAVTKNVHHLRTPRAADRFSLRERHSQTECAQEREASRRHCGLARLVDH